MSELMELVEDYRREADPDRATRLGFLLYQIIQPDLRLFILGKVHPSEVDDVLQEVLRSIFESLATFDKKTEKAFWAWCYIIVRRRISDHFRAKARKKTEAFPLEDIMVLVEVCSESHPLSPSERLEIEEALRLLEKSLPACREILWNRFVVGFEPKEIGREMKLKTDAVRRRIERCLLKARTVLAKHCECES